MQNIPSDNLAYPILLNLESGSSGSGFIVNDGKQSYLVTAKHVLCDPKNNLESHALRMTCPSSNINDDSTSVIDLNLEVLLKDGNLKIHPTADVSAVKIFDIIDKKDDGSYKQNPTKGTSVVKIADGGTVAINIEKPKFIKDVLISNDIFLYGYPSSIGMRKMPQFDYTKPLLRKGIIANINTKMNTIILDCPVYYGNSGGPVIEVENVGTRINHTLVGIVSQFIPFVENWKNVQTGHVNTEISNSGYSVAVALDSLFEII